MNPTITHLAETHLAERKRHGDNPNHFRRDRNKVMVNQKRVKIEQVPEFLNQYEPSESDNSNSEFRTYLLWFFKYVVILVQSN